jgi:hypothetical protein
MGRKSQKTDIEVPPGEPLTGSATAEYLSAILPELVRVADRGGLDMVAYLLEMARIAAAEDAMKTNNTKVG